MIRNINTWTNKPTQQVVLNFWDFEKWYMSDEPQRTVAWERMNALKVVLEDSDENIKDPIDFLYSLYFHQKLSLDKILENELLKKAQKRFTLYTDSSKDEETFGDKNPKKFYSKKWLGKLLKESFWWELRKKTDRTPEHEKLEDEQVEVILKEVWNRVGWILNPKNQYPSFSIRNFRKIKYRVDKVLYILQYLWWIDIEKLIKTFQELEYWPRRTYKYLNEVVSKILDDSYDFWIKKADSV